MKSTLPKTALRHRILLTLIISAGALSANAWAQDSADALSTDRPTDVQPSHAMPIAPIAAVSPSSSEPGPNHQEAQTQRPKIGVALSGGGSRGLAHIGVLRALEQQHVPIDYIAGTSAGALIGGMYASGMSLDEIEQRVKNMDFDKILYERQSRRTQTQFARANEYYGNGMVDMSITREGVVALPQSVMQDGKVEQALREILKDYPYNIDFDRLPIPFRAVTTDLATGEKVVLSKGKLAEALRASMSIPAVFAPVEMDGRLLVDGMVASNLPIDVVRQMGADRIIAVNVGTGLLPKEKIKNVVNVSEQLLSILVQRNVTDEVKTLGKQDVYIPVDVGDIGNLQFNRINEAIDYGVKTMHEPKISRQVATLSVPTQQYNSLMAKHEVQPEPGKLISFVRVQTNGIANPEALRRKVTHQAGKPLNMNLVDEDIRQLMNVDRIESVRYDIQPVGNAYELVYYVQEKDTASKAVSAGLELATSNLTKQNVALHLSHRNVWLNRWGAEWRSYVTLGKNTDITTLFNQPLNYGQNWFIRPQLNFGFSNNQAYLPDQNDAASEYDVNRQNASLMLGQTLGDKGEWGISARWQRAHLASNLTNPNLLIHGETQRHFTVDAEITLDQLDDLYIPTDGYFLRAYGRIAPKKSDDDDKRFIQAGIKALWAKRLNPRHSVAFGLEAAGQNNPGSVYLSPYHLGGYHRLSGYEQNQFVGNYLALTGVSYRYISPWKMLNKPLILGTSLEIGNTWEKTDDISSKGLKMSASLFGAINTPIGPAQLGLGITRSGNANLYFYLGRTFSDW